MRCFIIGIASIFAIHFSVPEAHSEDLNDAWSLALRLNGTVQARELDSFSAWMNLGSARAARMPSLNVTALNAFLSQSPSVKLPAAFDALGAGSSGAASAFKGGFPVLGANQSDVPFVLANISQPIYQGGRIRSNIAASDAGVKYQKTEEFRAVLDLKLTVAEAYVGVLRASRNLEVLRSNVTQLAAFLRDVTNRKGEGQATRNEELAAKVSLANATLEEIRARKDLEVARETYNRYLYRPAGFVVDLQEIVGPPTADSLDALSAKSLAERAASIAVNEPAAADLASRALHERPELEGYVQRANQSEAQANVTMATIKPQVSFNASYVDVGSQNFTNPNIFAGTFQLSWTLFDGGQTRKRAQAQRLQAQSYMKQKADAAADVVLQVRTRMLDVDESLQRVIVSGAAVMSADENIKVVTDRYRQGLSIYTEVLDAEARRIASLNGYYSAAYDHALAAFRLRRAVGDL